MLKGKLVIEINKTMLVVNIVNILYIEKVNSFIKIHLKGTKDIVLRMTMKEICKIIVSNNISCYLIRVHCSYIININYIKKIKRSLVELIDEICIPISKAYSKSTFPIIKEILCGSG